VIALFVSVMWLLEHAIAIETCVRSTEGHFDSQQWGTELQVQDSACRIQDIALHCFAYGDSLFSQSTLCGEARCNNRKKAVTQNFSR
jgi:hypothetical protein